MPYLELQGMRLFYERHGAGNPPLAFANGYAWSHEVWQPRVDFFHTRQSVITYGLRAHGASDGAPDHCSIETFGADLSALLSCLELQPAIV